MERKSITGINVKLEETIKPNISNKSKNILSVDCVEQFIRRRNVEVSLTYHVIVVTLEEHMSYCRLSTYGCRAFDYAGPTVWNTVPDDLRNSDSFDSFKRFVKTILFSRY